jgi:hypothetical protein
MASAPSNGRADSGESDSGQLVLSGLELTSCVRQLTRRMGTATVPLRKLHILALTQDEIPAEALHGGIAIVPDGVSDKKSYRLPHPRLVTKGQSAGRGYDFFVRNDCAHEVKVITEQRNVILDGADSIAPTTGSMWYVSIVATAEGVETSQVTRLM